MSAQAPAPLIPFRYGTRQRHQRVTTVPFTTLGDSFSTQPFPRVGFLSKVICQFVGSITIANANTALADRGPWNLIKKIQGQMNLGSATIWDLSGFGAFLVQSGMELGGRFDFNGIGASPSETPDPDLFLFPNPLVVGANPVVLTWVFYVGANDHEQFSMGLINLQAPQVQFTLAGNWGAAADIVAVPANLTAMSGNLTVAYEYYDVPNPNEVQLPPPMLVRRLEDNQPITVVGENIYTIPRQGVMVDLKHIVTLNGARSNSEDLFQLVINNTDFIYKYTRPEMKIKQRFQYLTAWPVGVFGYDLWEAANGVSNGDTRDAVDTEANSLTESRVTISANAVLGVGNNQLTSIRTIFQNLAQ